MRVRRGLVTVVLHEPYHDNGEVIGAFRDSAEAEAAVVKRHPEVDQWTVTEGDLMSPPRYERASLMTAGDPRFAGDLCYVLAEVQIR